MLETSFSVLIWLIILLIFGFVLDNLWKKIFSGNIYRLFLAPGIIIHELSHALVGRMVGAKIEEINFFSKQGGFVKYRSSDFVRPLSEMFINFAPVLGGIGALLFFSWILDLQMILWLADFQQPFFQGLRVVIQKIPSFVFENWLKWQFWLFVYLAISIIICLIPSKVDIKNALGGILVIFILGLIFPRFLEIIFNQYLGNILVFGSMLGFLALIFTLPVFCVINLINNYDKI